MFAGKPIIGIAGGIGSGKSSIARLFGELGGAVLDADAQVRMVYENPAVRQTLRQWWGDGVLNPDGSINRSAVAQMIFSDPQQRRRLEQLIHPLVGVARQRGMEKSAINPLCLAFIWDTPLLFEVGLNGECDAVVFVDAPREIRLKRVAAGRGWDEAELIRRENLQLPLYKKREISDYVIENAADVGTARSQVRDVFSRILERAEQRRPPLAPT
jgi:dephospho-CoA kinase